jgi:hypothetical protein
LQEQDHKDGNSHCKLFLDDRPVFEEGGERKQRMKKGKMRKRTKRKRTKRKKKEGEVGHRRCKLSCLHFLWLEEANCV